HPPAHSRTDNLLWNQVQDQISHTSEATDLAPAKAAQQTRLQPWQEQGLSLHWCDLSDLAPDSITGCLFSNELVDALPVHRVTLTEQGLQECYVASADNAMRPFQIITGPLSTPALAAYFKEIDITLATPPYPIGFTTEVNLAALDWIEQVGQVLHRGYVMTIDYGYPAERYYGPTRSHGTLQCYSRHAYHDDPLINVGQQDITAHVDFTALERRGQQQGLTTLGNLPQALFLMALGLGDRLSELAQWQGTDGATLTTAIRRRDCLHQLMNPMGLGKFNVLVQGKGLATPSQQKLKGLTVPA
ncbi:MAG: SAM-dependent methyltransferase, partial [Cyanobacteria bacterium J06626_18]